jgi:hypothetical protein
MTQRDDDMQAAHALLGFERCGCEVCMRSARFCPADVGTAVERIADALAAARKEALVADPVRKFLAHPKSRGIVRAVGVLGGYQLSFWHATVHGHATPFESREPESACEAALNAMEESGDAER